MKLNLNVEELLALHNLLRDTLNVYDGIKESSDSDRVRLRGVYNRVRAYFVNALSGREGDDLLETVLMREQAKIDKLRDAEMTQTGPIDAVKKYKDYIVPAREDDLEVLDYPKRARTRGSRRR
jgi:hypothetical protein